MNLWNYERGSWNWEDAPVQDVILCGETDGFELPDIVWVDATEYEDKPPVEVTVDGETSVANADVITGGKSVVVVDR